MNTQDGAHWSAVVLGGGDPGDPFAAAHGVKVKPLIPVSGLTMAERVLRAPAHAMTQRLLAAVPRLEFGTSL